VRSSIDGGGDGVARRWSRTALVERYAPADLVYLPQAPAGRRRGRPRRPQRLGTASRPAGTQSGIRPRFPAGGDRGCRRHGC
jgi:hypothetical protein